MSDTIVSAGCETTAQIMPARYPRGEGDTELGRLGIGLLWRRENVGVELLNDAFEKEKPFQTLHE